MIRKLIDLMAIVAVTLGQAPQIWSQTPASPRKPAAMAKSDVDNVIDLVKGGMSEALVIKTLQREGKTYKLETADLLKLQRAGVTENIINVMMDPKTTVKPATPSIPSVDSRPGTDPSSGGAAPAPAPPPPAVADTVAKVTPPPPDLPITPTARKRRVVIAPFDYAGIRDTVQTFYQNYYQAIGIKVPATVQATDDVGQGIRAMLMTRLQQSNVITVLERNAAIDRELQNGLSMHTDQGSRPIMGRTLGADCVVTGDITIWGRDDKNKRTGGGGAVVPGWKGLGGGGFGLNRKEDKAVVGIEFRIVDSETSEIILSAKARGESRRTSKNLDLGGLGIGRAGAAGGIFGNGTTSSGFEKTILGEATEDAINQIAKKLEEEIPKLPAKPRSIEGRLAAITDGGVYLALSSNDGVQMGDRFEVRQINNEVLDPQTKETIALDAVKVGEVVIKEVNNKSSLGDYGGQPLSPDRITGKGYQVRLVSK